MAEGKDGNWDAHLRPREDVEWPEGEAEGCRLGQGSYGAVFRVSLGGAPVACKVNTILRDPAREPRIANPYWPLHPDERRRQTDMWRSEIDLLVRAQGSPYVTRLVGVVLDDAGCPEYLLTEMARGSLYSVLHDDSDATGGDGPRGGAPLPLREASRIMLCIAKGLQHLHEICDPPITHRDLSAKNVLVVDKSGPGGGVHVCSHGPRPGQGFAGPWHRHVQPGRRGVRGPRVPPGRR